MINIVSKPLEFDDELKKKIEFICDFCNTKKTKKKTMAYHYKSSFYSFSIYMCNFHRF